MRPERKIARDANRTARRPRRCRNFQIPPYLAEVNSPVEYCDRGERNGGEGREGRGRRRKILANATRNVVEMIIPN